MTACVERGALPASEEAGRLSPQGPDVLRFTEGYWIDRVIELFLIGDEDSLFHGRRTFALTADG